MNEGILAARRMDAVEALNADVKRLARALGAKDVAEVAHVPGVAGPERALLQLESVAATVRTLARAAEAKNREAKAGADADGNGAASASAPPPAGPEEATPPAPGTTTEPKPGKRSR